MASHDAFVKKEIAEMQERQKFLRKRKSIALMSHPQITCKSCIRKRCPQRSTVRLKFCIAIISQKRA